MPLSKVQKEKLLEGLNPSRTSKRKAPGGSKMLSYMEAWEIKAHLTRLFGHGGWSWVIREVREAYCDAGTGKEGKNYDVGFSVTGDLTLFGIGPAGQDVVYSGSAVGSSQLPSKGDAFDNAVKNGDSDAIKRAAIMLGDQFGLSLYRDGQTKPVVVKIWAPNWDGIGGKAEAIPSVDPTEEQPAPEHVTETVPEPVAEPDPTPDESGAIGDYPAEDAPPVTDEPPTPAETEAADNHPGAMEFVDRLRMAMSTKDVKAVVAIKSEISAANAGEWMFEGRTLNKLADLAVVHAGKKG